MQVRKIGEKKMKNLSSVFQKKRKTKRKKHINRLRLRFNCLPVVEKNLEKCLLMLDNACIVNSYCKLKKRKKKT